MKRKEPRFIPVAGSAEAIPPANGERRWMVLTPGQVLLRALDAAYPRADVEDAWWLGNGLIHLKPRVNYLELIGFWVAPNRRKQGHGTLMLDLLCALADRYGVELRTWADAYDAGRRKDRDLMGPGELRAWYARWGFYPTTKGRRRTATGKRILRREPRREIDPPKVD